MNKQSPGFPMRYHSISPLQELFLNGSQIFQKLCAGLNISCTAVNVQFQYELANGFSTNAVDLGLDELQTKIRFWVLDIIELDETLPGLIQAFQYSKSCLT